LIREALTYLSENPKLEVAKKFGHLSESISLIEREKRCSKAWLPHRTQCKQFILNQTLELKDFENVLILGSGPLHEIPIEELSKKFKKVILVDIVHLKSTKKSIAHLSNIEFVEHDITECEAELLSGNFTSIEPKTFLETKFSLILSVNIMSQLPIHIENYIENNLRSHFNKNTLALYLENLSLYHLEYLKKFNSPALIITDVETIYYDTSGNVFQTDINYSHLSLPKKSDEWIWNVAPIPEFRKDVGIRMKVAAFKINIYK
jgi:hypothetical protein